MKPWRHLRLFDLWHGAVLAIITVFYVAVSCLWTQ